MAWKFLCSVHLGWKGGCSQAEAVLDFRAVVSAGPNLTSGCSLQGSLGNSYKKRRATGGKQPPVPQEEEV